MKLRELFWQKGWFMIIPLALALIAIWVWPGLTLPPVASVSSSGDISERTQILYLLSAIPQTLGAILALVFTIYLVVYQVFSKYTLRMPSGNFGIATIAYIVLFIASILFPLWTIGTPSINLVKLSLSLACLSLCLLVPYSLYFKEFIAPQYAIQKIKDSMLRQIKEGNSLKEETVEALDNIVMSAYGLKDYDTFNKGVRVFAEIAFESEKKEREELKSGKNLDVNKYYVGSIYDRIESIMRISLEDPRAPSQVFRALEIMAIKAVKQELPSVVDTLIYRIGPIGELLVKRGLNELAGYVVMRLGILASVAIDKHWIESLHSTTEGYYYTVSDFLKSMMETSVRGGANFTMYHILGAYSKMGEVAIRRNMKDIAQESINAIRECAIKASYHVELKEEADQAVWEMANLGAAAIIHSDETIRNYLINQMKSLEEQLTQERIVNTLNKHIQIWQTFKGKKSIEMVGALKKMIEYYRQ